MSDAFNEEAPRSPFPFTVIDVHGQVLQSGLTMHVEGLVPEGCTCLRERAPLNAYRIGNAWVPMPVQPSPFHIFDWSTKQWVDHRTLDVLRADQIAAIDQSFRRGAAALTAGYPEEERLTWSVQQSEALAWGTDQASATPFLDGLARSRGIDPALMREKTLEAVNVFMAASQQLIGMRQRLRDAVWAAETPEQIAAVVWPN
ncbi:hypothetical protein [Variovorax sp. PAMC26660]|uniref:hypothetical protein n=1 Tax=Variovorax sp. PAMC26660 TaxID=2762322 RepID=UPI00164DE7A8|nr:hypothetical protein [Variovorax sp. PAMC26660]QNK70249.1 hypothetical protein H7F35_11460 [Variovorax sp. PAMC26660]